MKIAKAYFSVLLAALLLSSTAVINAQEHSSNSRPGVADMLEKVTPAVVNISVTGHLEQPQNLLLNDPFFRRFFETPDQSLPNRRTQSVGSGVIIDSAKGYVLTNHHVVSNADEIEVTLHDRRKMKASLIGSDEGTDIALLQIEAENLQAIPLSDSESLRVGDLVLAIGNPFGIGQTVTTGMVSALGRTGISRDGYEDFIQTDASINPGNSGGALIDYKGDLLGINTAIIAPSRGNVGIGFSVPINMAMSVVDQLLEFGEIKRGVLGVEITDLTPDVAAALELDISSGAVVQRVQQNSAASKSGIEAGDIIVEVNGEEIKDKTDLRNKVGLSRLGSDLSIVLVRDKKRKTLTATLGEAQDAKNTESSADLGESYLNGVELTNASQGSKEDAVLVLNVSQESKAWRYGLRANDLITAVNNKKIKNVDELNAQMKLSKGAVALNITREGQSMFLILR